MVNMTLRFVFLVTLLILALSVRSTVDAFSIPKWSGIISFQQQVHRSQNVLARLASNSKSDASVATTGILAMMVLLEPSVAMASTEVELAELPPPWIPVVFGIGLVVVRSICLGDVGHMHQHLTVYAYTLPSFSSRCYDSNRALVY